LIILDSEQLSESQQVNPRKLPNMKWFSGISPFHHTVELETVNRDPQATTMKMVRVGTTWQCMPATECRPQFENDPRLPGLAARWASADNLFSRCASDSKSIMLAVRGNFSGADFLFHCDGFHASMRLAEINVFTYRTETTVGD